MRGERNLSLLLFIVLDSDLEEALSGNSGIALLAKLHLGQRHVTSKKNVTCESVWKWGAAWACPACACTSTVWSTTNSALDKCFPLTRAWQHKVVTLSYSRVIKSPTLPLPLQISLVQLIMENIPSAQTDREGMKCCHTSGVLRVINLYPPISCAIKFVWPWLSSQQQKL